MPHKKFVWPSERTIKRLMKPSAKGLVQRDVEVIWSSVTLDIQVVNQITTRPYGPWMKKRIRGRNVWCRALEDEEQLFILVGSDLQRWAGCRLGAIERAERFERRGERLARK